MQLIPLLLLFSLTLLLIRPSLSFQKVVAPTKSRHSGASSPRLDRLPCPKTVFHRHADGAITLLHALGEEEAVAATTRPISVGFLGCGTIATAIATGLLSQSTVPVEHIAVTRRSASRSSQLVARFPNAVSVHDDNQSVVDRSDIVFCCVLPQQTAAVLQELEFTQQQHLVSLVSTATLEDLSEASRLSMDRVFKMICLPSVAQCDGVCLLLSSLSTTSPPSDKNIQLANSSNKQTIVELCQSLGGCVQATSQEEMSALMVVTGMMGPFYGLLRNHYEFLTAQGIAPHDANQLIGRLYHSMLQDVTVRLDADSNQMQDESENLLLFDELIAEQTPGGLNEQALANLEKLGVMESYRQVQAALLSRIRGESDGSLS